VHIFCYVNALAYYVGVQFPHATANGCRVGQYQMHQVRGALQANRRYMDKLNYVADISEETIIIATINTGY
jgi:hypothetical protein